jgi:hypothetical protein
MPVWLYSIFYLGLQKNKSIVYTLMETELVLNKTTKPTPDNSVNDNGVPVQAPAEPTKCCNCITSRLKDQDFMQKFSVSISFVLELYRVLMGTMLIMFVPQKCGEDMCGITDNMFRSTDVYSVNAGVNIATLIAFVYLYVVEVRRENTLINYLDINKEFACDNDAVGEALLLLPDKKRHLVLNLDHSYQLASYVALFFFLANTIFSGYSVYYNYLDSKTTSVFITNVLFLAGKLIQTNALANTEENVFYSAYLTDRIQYNYVDPDKISIENQSAEISLSYDVAYSKNSV